MPWGGSLKMNAKHCVFTAAPQMVLTQDASPHSLFFKVIGAGAPHTRTVPANL